MKSSPENYTCFLILTGGRSGSTVIRDALQCHPDVLCFGELFENQSTWEFTSKEIELRHMRQNETPTTYVQQAIFCLHGNSYQAIGFKIKYFHFDENDLRNYLRHANVKIIHNRRRNLMAQSLSLPLAIEHDFMDANSDSLHKGRYIRPVMIDVNQAIFRAEYYLERGAYFDNWFRPYVPVHDLYYEDFCQTDKDGNLTNQTAVDQLLDFLTLKPYRLKTQFLKQRQKPYHQLIENYDELRQKALQIHPEWQPFFEEFETS